MFGTFCGDAPSMPSPEKDSHVSNLHTTITTHLGNISFELPTIGTDAREVRENRADQVSYRKGRDFFEDSLCFKLHQLEQKSSKIMSKLPSIHSKIVKAQGFSRSPIEHPFLPTSSTYGNKLKIIRDLSEKIDQLENNINNPLMCHEHMRTIQKEINLDFQNYYQEIKENNAGEKENAASQDSFDSNDEQHPQTPNPDVQTQTSIFSTTQIKQLTHITIPVYVPKIIEIQIPVDVYRTKKVDNSSHQSKNSFQEPGSLPAESNGAGSKSASGSSIENIINRFNQCCYPTLQQHSHQYIYRINTVDQEESAEREQFNLPLNSYEQCASEQARSKKKTDRSSPSSENEDIWNKEEIQFSHEHLSLVKEQQAAPSEHNSDHYHIDEDRERVLIQLNKKITSLTNENLELQGKFQAVRTQKQELAAQMRLLENKKVEMEMDFQHEDEKMNDLIEENKQLNSLVLTLKEALFARETQQQELLGRIKQMEREYTARMEQREGEIHELLKTIHQKTEELEQYFKTNEQIKKLLKKKEEDYQNHLSHLEATVQELKDEMSFYKAKLEQEDGINLKLEEASIIRDLLEKKQQEERQHMNSLQLNLENKYRGRLQQLKIQNDRLQLQLNEIRNNPSMEWASGDNNNLEKQVQDLLEAYNSELFKKEEEITELRKLSWESAQEEVHAISSIKNALIGEGEDPSSSKVQWVCLLNRLLRSIKLYAYAVRKEKEQRAKLAAKITSLNLFFNRQIEKAEEKNFKSEQQLRSTKKHAQEALRELKKTSKKLQFYRSKLEISTSPHQMSHVLELQNQYLQLENKKLVDKFEKAKKYSEELEDKFLNGILQTGTSFCQHFCKDKQSSENNKHEENEFQKKITSILQEMKEQCSKSVLFAQENMNSNSTITNSRLNQCRIASTVFAITSKPPSKPTTPALKALLTPLPEIPKTIVSSAPPTSITLDQLLLKRIFSGQNYRQKVASKLLDLAIELNRVSKRLFSLKPSQVLVNWSQGEVEIILRRQFGSSTEDDESMLIYRAPEVLLGFNQSEASYVWTIGLIIDHIFHEKVFYKKVNDVLSRKDNYYVRNPELAVRPLLEKMLVKNHKDRQPLALAKQQLLDLCQL